MSSPTYNQDAGTTIGEIRNEIYNKYGYGEYTSAQYGWHHEHVSTTETKIYNLVQSGVVRFLIATVTYELVDARLKDPITKKVIDSSQPEMLVPNIENPTSITFEWRDAGIPFVSKEVCDKNNISYTL